MSRSVATLFAILLGLVPASRAVADDAAAEFFEKKVRPVLAEHCFTCHSDQAKKLKGGLRLDSRAALLKGGDSGAAIVPGEPANSLLLKAVGYKDVDLQMPPKGKLPDAAVADLTVWVKSGAAWPGTTTAQGQGTKSAFDLQ